MTWSIVARDAASGAFGVAIATRFFAAGALCPHAESGVGALSTQALVNPHYGPQALELLRAGVPAPEVVKRVTAPDEGRDHRQLHVIDAAARIGQHTGAQCIDWCGAVAGDGYSVAGNMLANERGEVRAVDGVSFSLERGRTLGIVGESGCGKSVTALSIMGLVPQPPGRIAGGEVLFDGEDLLKLPAARLRDLRGDKLAMIFQEPMTSLNPAFPVGEQITETLLRHRNLGRKEAQNQAIEMLRRVRIPSPERRADDYPHQLSGGMRQRVMIAMALACN